MDTIVNKISEIETAAVKIMKRNPPFQRKNWMKNPTANGCIRC